jgi:hypothetical protein
MAPGRRAGLAQVFLNDIDDAIAAYRLACADVPFAQSATTALAVALVANHQPDCYEYSRRRCI